MVKRPPKKESKMKQKQRQNQNVTVNIGTLAKKPRSRKPTKPRQAPQPQQSTIVTRGPTTFYQQPQPQPQGQSINELYKLIQQQAQANQPAQQQTTASIVPPPKVEDTPKAENDLERIRKARVAKFDKPELEKVFEQQSSEVGLEDSAYRDFNKLRSITQLFREAESKQGELQVSLLNEVAPPPSINLHPLRRIVPDYVEPNLSLQPSSLFAPPSPVSSQSSHGFLEVFSNSPSLELRQNAQSLLSEFEPDEEKLPEYMKPAYMRSQSFLSTRGEPLSIRTGIPAPSKDDRLLALEERKRILREQKNELELSSPFIEQGPEIQQETIEVPEPLQPEPAPEPEPPQPQLNRRELYVQLAIAIGLESKYPKLNNMSVARLENLIIDNMTHDFDLPFEIPEDKDIPAYISQIQLSPKPPSPTSPKKGSANLPPIIQQPPEETPLVQLLNPTPEPSLVATAAAEPSLAAAAEEPSLAAVSQAQLIALQGTPKAQLMAFAKNLGVQTSSGMSGKHLTTELIKQNIYDKMGRDFEIPTFTGKKPGPPKQSGRSINIE